MLETINPVPLNHRLASFPEPDALPEFLIAALDLVPMENGLPFHKDSGYSPALQSVARKDGLGATSYRDERRHAAGTGEFVVSDDRAAILRKANRNQFVINAMVVPDETLTSGPQSDSSLSVSDASIVDNDWPGIELGPDTCHGIFLATIVPDDGLGLLLTSDPGHAVVVTMVVFDNGTRLCSGANTDPRPPVVVTVVLAHHRGRSLAHSDACADVVVAFVSNDQRDSMVVVTNPGMKVFEAPIAPNDATATAHDSDPASHVAEGDVVSDEDMHWRVFLSSNGDPSVAIVMDEAVGNPARNTVRSDPGQTEASDAILILPSLFPVLLPKGLVISPDIADGETINDCLLGHRDTWGFSITTAINDRGFGPSKSQLPRGLIAIAHESQSGFERHSFLVNSWRHQDPVACAGLVDGGLDRCVVGWHSKVGSRGIWDEKKGGKQSEK